MKTKNEINITIVDEIPYTRSISKDVFDIRFREIDTILEKIDKEIEFNKHIEKGCFC